MEPVARAFPPGFLWGVSTSAYQIEGAATEDGRGPSIWDTFCRLPGRVSGGDTGDVACDHYCHWRKDVDLVRAVGARAYRFSVSWPRVIPEGTGAVNQNGLAFYDRLVDALLEVGVEPVLTLYHWDLPQSLQNRGGWPERATAEAFSRFADVACRKLGDRVGWWVTHNEPYVSSILGHWTGEHAPGLRDRRLALQAAHHMLVSHGLAARAIRAAAPRPVKVGIALNLQPVHAASDRADDVAASRRADGLMNRWFLDPLFRGEYPADMVSCFGADAPEPADGDMELAREPLDCLGVNYYTRFIAAHDPDSTLIEVSGVQPNDAERSLMWEVYPQGLPELLRRLWADYRPAQILITENGTPCDDRPDASGRVADAERVSYLERHVAGVATALAEGVPVRGYFVWSLLDNFEWAFGYRMRFGLVHVDFLTQKRTPKDSARWYARWVAEHFG